MPSPFALSPRLPNRQLGTASLILATLTLTFSPSPSPYTLALTPTPTLHSYISFFYIAFLKSRAVTLFGMTYTTSAGHVVDLSDRCASGDCMQDLFVQMVSVVLVKQFLRNALAITIPFLKRQLAVLKGRTTGDNVDEIEGVEKLEAESILSPPRGMCVACPSRLP